MSAKVIKISDYLKQSNFHNYKNRVQKLETIDLLAEMVKFQEERERQGLTPEIIKKGLILFPALNARAVTDELREMTRLYTNFLNDENTKIGMN